ncbi:MAG: nucleotidyltransferase family protein [Candidatus Paceibacterota bacterium]
MQALILAGGEGKRLRPLTDDKPKAMVLLNGRPLIEYVIDELPDTVSDIVMSVGYRDDVLRAHFGDSWNGRPIRYVQQEGQFGTWYAMRLAKDFIKEKFIMVQCDDIGDKKAFTEGSKYDYSVFAMHEEHPERYGVVEQNEDGTLKCIVEKPEHPSGNFVTTGAWILSPDAFKVELFKNDRLGEYFMTDLVSEIAKIKPVHVVEQNQWITVTYPEDVAVAETLLRTA